MRDRVIVPLDVRLLIARRDRWQCWCGQGYQPGDPWVIDHWIALANGGTNHVSNLRLAHRSCNTDKGAA